MEVLNTVLSEPVIIDDASPKSGHSNGLEDSGDTFSSALEEMISKLTNGLGNTGKLLIETSSADSGSSTTKQAEGSQGIIVPFGIAELGMTKDEANVNPVSDGDEEITVNLTPGEVEGEEYTERSTENQNERLDPIDNMEKSVSQGLLLTSQDDVINSEMLPTENAAISEIATSVKTGSDGMAQMQKTGEDDQPLTAISNSNGGFHQITENSQPEADGHLTQNGQPFPIDNTGKSVGRESTPMAPVGSPGGGMPMAEGVGSYSPNVILSPQGEESLDASLRSRMTPSDPSVVLHSAGFPQDDNVSSATGVERSAGQAITESANRPSIVNFSTAMGVDTLNPKLASSKDIVSQVVQHIVISVSKDKSNARIQLKPEFLGELKVKIEFANNQLTAKFEAANSVTKELLEASAIKIKQALEAHGLKIDEFVVQLKDGQHRHPGHGGFTDDGRDRKYDDGNSMRYSDETEEKVKNYYLDGLNEWVA